MLRRCANGCGSHQDFDHVHGATAMRTNESRLESSDRHVGIFRLYIVVWQHVQQRAQLRQVVLAFSIGKQPIVTDAMKAARQHMQEEAAHELVRIERHGFLARTSLGPIILPTEGDTVLVEVQ